MDELWKVLGYASEEAFRESAASASRARAVAQEEGLRMLETLDTSDLEARAAVHVVATRCPSIADPEIFLGLKETKAVHTVRRFMDHPEIRILVLAGGVGTGKSVAAAEAFARDARRRTYAKIREHIRRMPEDARAIVDRWDPREIRVYGSWVHARELARSIDPWLHEKDSGAVALDLGRPIIVLDDLGTERANDRFHEALGVFVDARAKSGKTIITTNVAKADVRKRYGDRIADRLNHVGACVEMKGETMRRKRAGL